MRIIIEPTTIRGERGQHYRVHFEGQVLIEDTWNPELEACRALVARGVTGRLEVWRTTCWCSACTTSASGTEPPAARHPHTIVRDIEGGASWTVVENDKEGPVIKRWVPYPAHLHQDVDQDAVSASTRLPPAAVWHPVVGVTHPQAQEPVFDAGSAK